MIAAGPGVQGAPRAPERARRAGPSPAGRSRTGPGLAGGVTGPCAPHAASKRTEAPDSVERISASITRRVVKLFRPLIGGSSPVTM